LSTPARSGVFSQATDRRVEAFTESVRFDYRLYAHDILGSQAHADMLAAVGLITADERARIVAGLGEIQEDIERFLRGEAGTTFQFRTELEDIHMHIEQALIDRLGDVGRKLHTARSRNDQVSTAFRLWIRDALDMIDRQLAELQAAFVERCERDRGVILPGYTHLQRAQPVLAAHYWLAYCEKFQRDRQRLQDCRRRVNQCPLGTAALAGTSLPIRRELTAERLGFEGLVANSLDASSDRDYVIETAFVLCMIAEHLSGWAEEWILWATTEFSMLQLPHDFCTGSSIMPQKINPDVLELTRGRTGRVVGNLQGLLLLVKGLPLAYNRDLQEDKEALFDSFDTVAGCLELAAPLVRGATLRREAIAARLEQGYLDSTTFMEYLMGRGVPQRTAHHLSGALVAEAMQRGQTLAELPLEVFQRAHADLDEDVYRVLGAAHAVEAFQSYGSTAPQEVEKQLQQWRSRLGIAGDTNR
jgi:argininosuccinate lyase